MVIISPKFTFVALLLALFSCATRTQEFPDHGSEDDPTDNGFGKASSVTCGGYILHNQQYTDKLGHRYAGVFTLTDSSGRVVRKHHYPEQIAYAKCMPYLLGAGEPSVLALNVCAEGRFCSGFIVYRLGVKIDEMVAFSGSTSEIIEFKDLDKDGKPEIIGYDGRFRYLDFSGGQSPALPVVLCRTKNIFQDCTSHFPDYVRGELKDAEDEIQKCKQNIGVCDHGDISADFVMIYGSRSLIGEGEAAHSWLRENMPDAEYRKRRWLFNRVDRGLNERSDMLRHFKNGAWLFPE